MISPDIFAAGRGGELRGSLPRIGLVVLLHLGVLWLVTRPMPYAVAPDARVWVQLLRPAVPPASPTDAAPRPPVRSPAAPAEKAPPSPAKAAQPPSQPAPAAMPLPDEFGAPAAAVAPADIVQRALKSAGAIDRELRAGQGQPLAAPPADSPGARLARGLAAAHAAVKPGWFEAARTELISAPNDPKRIYRVTTAMGEYCVYYPDKASMTANSDPRSGYASFGQPKMSSCPVPF